MNLNEIREQFRESILALAEKRGVDNVRVFGSYAKNQQKDSSDVDFLVRLKPGTDLMDLGGLQWELEELLGTKVDVVTEGGVSPYIKEQVFKEAVPL